MLSSHARNLILSWLVTNGVAARPTAWFVSFHVGDPGLNGDNELLVGTDADYVRQAVAFDSPSGGQAPNTGALSWTAAAGASAHNVTHVGIWDAVSGGNFLIGGQLAVPEARAASVVTTIGIGRIIAALD